MKELLQAISGNRIANIFCLIDGNKITFITKYDYWQ